MPATRVEVVVELLAAQLLEPQRLLRRIVKLPQVLRLARQTRVGASPYEVVEQLGECRLLRYRRDAPAVYREPVLICYALVNRPYILDLQPGKSVVQRYLEQGFDVYLIDWGVPSYGDRGRTLEQYVGGYLRHMVAKVLADKRCASLHLLGYCMGGTMSAMFSALFPTLTSTLTLLASPIDFSGRESLLNVWSDARYFEVDALLDAYGNCPAGFLQSAFLFTKPVQNLLEKSLTFYEQMEDPEFLQNFFAVDRWVSDNIPVAGETFRQFVKELYQQNVLVRGELRLGGSRIDLARIDCPLLLLTARNDHLVPSSSTIELRRHVGSRDIEITTIEAGHVGLVVSSKAHRTLWPRATRWLAERSEPVRNERATPRATPTFELEESYDE
jgi:polyhydroxyalkanoate synthase